MKEILMKKGQRNKGKRERERGITLIALVITIIVLLILAGVTIATLTGDNGILTKASQAKEENILGQEKDEMLIAYSGAMLEKEGKDSVVADDLNSQFSTNGTLATANGDDPIVVTFTETGNVYTINSDGTITEGTPYIDDSYVQYDVSYTDVTTGTKYTKNTGWRILNQNQNEDGTYDLDIISTGIPAGLYYDYSSAKTSVWAGTATDIENYQKEYFEPSPNEYTNIYVASGLRYNFSKILFEQTTSNNVSANNGYYTEITTKNVKQSGTITGECFIAREGATVRSVTLGDIRGDNSSTDYDGITSYTSGDEYADKRAGLFKLDDYTPDVHKGGSLYWLATPYEEMSYSIFYVTSYGYIYGYYRNDMRQQGLRPVISMNGVTMEKDENVWKITN